MITLILMGILLAIAFSVISRFIAWSCLNIAMFQSQEWKITRCQATGHGKIPILVCMAQIGKEQIQYTQI